MKKLAIALMAHDSKKDLNTVQLIRAHAESLKRAGVSGHQKYWTSQYMSEPSFR